MYNWNWKLYIKKLKDEKIRPVLEEAVLLSKPGLALDIGAGALNETKYLLERGFKVIAIDPNSEDDDVLKIPIQEYIFPTNTFSLVCALLVFPFLPKKDIPDIMRGVANSLKKNGIIVAHFFGSNDTWSNRCATHSSDEIRSLIDDTGLTIIKLTEQQYDKKTAKGILKHWHVFTLIAKK